MGRKVIYRSRRTKDAVWDRAQAAMDKYGVLRYSDLYGLGVRTNDLFFLTFVGGIRFVKAGLYVRSHLEPSPAVLALRRINNGTLCLLSALHIFGLLDRAPERVWVAIPRSQRRPLPRIAPLEVIRVPSRLHDTGSAIEYVDGVPILVTTPVRTVVDCLRFHRKIGIDLARYALRMTLESGLFSTDELLSEAQRCRASKIMRAELGLLRPALAEVFRSERRDKRKKET